MFGISYVTFVFCLLYYAPNRLLQGCACYWFTPIRYYQLISCINWPLVPAQNRGSPIPAASSKAAQKTATRDRNTDNKVTCFYTIGLVQVITVRYFTEKVTDNHNLHIINRKKHLFFTTAATKTVWLIFKYSIVLILQNIHAICALW